MSERAPSSSEHPAPTASALPRWAAPALIATLLATALPFALEARRHARNHALQRRMPVDQATVPSATAIRALSLGHHEWAADLLFTSALMYFGESMQNRSRQRFLQAYARTTEEVDPQFRRAYLWGATVSIYTHRLITRQSVEHSNEHLRRGLERFTDDGEMLFQLGFNYSVELPPYLRDPAEKREARRRGAHYLQRAAAMGYGPSWLPLSAARALEESGEGMSAIELLRVTLLRTDDPAIRERLERRIRDLSGTDDDPALAHARAQERERNAVFPYVSPALYLFVGPPALRAEPAPTPAPTP